MDKDTDELVVENDESEQRFQVETGGRAAVLEYELAGDEMVLTHTEVAPELEGRGLAAKLARAALEHARERGLKVVPRCSFVASYIRRHTEYAALVRKS